VLGALARESQGFFVALKLFFGCLSRCFATILYSLPFYLNKIWPQALREKKQTEKKNLNWGLGLLVASLVPTPPDHDGGMEAAGL
jgi:hypothetical protein